MGVFVPARLNPIEGKPPSFPLFLCAEVFVSKEVIVSESDSCGCAFFIVEGSALVPMIQLNPSSTVNPKYCLRNWRETNSNSSHKRDTDEAPGHRGTQRCGISHQYPLSDTFYHSYFCVLWFFSRRGSIIGETFY